MKLTIAASLLFSSMLASGAYWATTVIPASHSQIDGMTKQINSLETLIKDRVYSQRDHQKEFGDNLIADEDGKLRFSRGIHDCLYGQDDLSLPDGFHFVKSLQGEPKCKRGWTVESIDLDDGDYVVHFVAEDTPDNRASAHYHRYDACHHMKVKTSIVAK